MSYHIFVSEYVECTSDNSNGVVSTGFSEYVECTSDNNNGVVSTGFSKVSTICDRTSALFNRLKNENEGIKTYRSVE